MGKMLRFTHFSLGNRHLRQAGFEFILLPSIVHARLVVEPVETHQPVSLKKHTG